VRRISWASPLAVVALLAGAGCMTQRKGAALTEVQQLVGWIERVHTSAELAKERTHAAMNELQSIAALEFEGDPVAAYTSFAVAVDQSGKQVADLQKCLLSLKDAGEPVFKHWAEDLATFDGADLRARSEARLSETRKRYDAVLAAADAARTTYETFDRKLRDYCIYLGHDLNASSVAAIEGDVRAMVEMNVALEARLEACQEAARSYVEAAALPTTKPVSSEPAPRRGARGSG